MFATLIPNDPDMLVIAGVMTGTNKSIVSISVISGKRQTIPVNYETTPTDFREDYCLVCSYYSENAEFNSGLNREDFIDEEAYEEALEEAANSIDPDDYQTEEEYKEAVLRAKEEIEPKDFINEEEFDIETSQEYHHWQEYYVCSGGIDVISDEDCQVYNLEDITQEGIVNHTTIPHMYRYTLDFRDNHRYPIVQDYLFALDDDSDDNATNTDQEGEMQIRVAPYQAGNVFNNGTICWGDNCLSYNMRHQYSLFWSSVFNGDLIPYDEPVAYWLENFHKNETDLDWEWVSASLLFGSEGISSDQETELPIEGVLIIPGSEPYLTWIFKDSEGYFAYTVEGDPNSRLNLEPEVLHLR